MDMLIAVLNGRALRVAVYLLAAVLSFAAAWQASPRSRRRDRPLLSFWLATGSILVVLALSREVDLAARIAEIGRTVFRTEGWYASRRPAQEAAVLATLAGAGSFTVGGSVALIRMQRGRIVPGFGALMALATFLVVRAISLHDIDAVLYGRAINHVYVNAVAELAATLLIAVAALLTLSIQRSRARS